MKTAREGGRRERKAWAALEAVGAYERERERERERRER